MAIRRFVAVGLGLLSWIVVASLLDREIRLAWPAYAARIAALDFTTSMMVARLVIGSAATVAAGRLAAWWSAGDRVSIWSLGLVLVAIFAPVHYQLWAKFPIAYHAIFLGSLVPLTWRGGRGLPRFDRHRFGVHV